MPIATVHGQCILWTQILCTDTGNSFELHDHVATVLTDVRLLPQLTGLW